MITWPPGARPIIWAVYVISKLSGFGDSSASGSTGGSSGLSQTPTSLRELKRRLAKAGFTIESGAKADRVMWKGEFFFNLHTTPSEYRSLANVWAQIRRKALTRGVEL